MQNKNQPIVNLILTVFLGYLGVHRFYRKQYKLGILYLFTLGLFGIGWLVDIICAISSLVKMSTTESDISGREIPASVITENYYVTGIKYHQKDLESLGIINQDYALSKTQLYEKGLIESNIYEYNFNPIFIDLKPEPDNPYDPNAIMVLIDNAHVGYIKKGNCTHIKKLLNSNSIVSISAHIGGGNFKYLVQHDEENTVSSYDLEKGNAPYTIKLTLTLKQ